MRTETVELAADFAVSPSRLYDAWLNAKEHSAFTGADATVDAKEGGAFTAWDGYISGVNVCLEPKKRIVQRWRSTEFPKGSGDSCLEVLFEAIDGGTRVVIVHTDIPKGQAKQYSKGWKEFYFKPMRAYFSKSGTTKPAANKKATKKKSPASRRR